MIHKSRQSGQAGQALIMTVILLGGIMIGTTAVAGIVLVNAVRSSTLSGFSTQAIYAADAGLEWELYQYYVNPLQDVPQFSASNPNLNVETCSFVWKEDNSALPFSVRKLGPANDYTCPNSNADYTIRSVGISGPSGKEVRRAFELIFRD